MSIQDQLREMGQEIHSAECLEAADYIDQLEAVVQAARAYFGALDHFSRRYPGALAGPGQGDVRRALRRLMLNACPHGSTMESCGAAKPIERALSSCSPRFVATSPNRSLST